MKKHLQRILPHSRSAFIIWAVVFLALAYIMASKAIDTGSLQQYGITFVLICLFVRFFVSIFKLGNAKKR